MPVILVLGEQRLEDTWDLLAGQLCKASAYELLAIRMSMGDLSFKYARSIQTNIP